jgi:hypothetical protein
MKAAIHELPSAKRVDAERIGYHYTNPVDYRSMRGGRSYGKTGLLPIRRLVPLFEGPRRLSDEAHDGTIQGLLEPEPTSWTKNPKFPKLWQYLMGDICRESEVMLLSFEILPTDAAFVLERAHMERELYKPEGRSTKASKNRAFSRYWRSRVPVSQYDGSYSVPQLTLWSTIAFERLRVEWVKPTDAVWKRVLNSQ